MTINRIAEVGDYPNGAVFLMRHGQTDLNVKGVWQCWQDEPLNENGLMQVRGEIAIVESIGPEVIFASDFLRARQIAEILSSDLDVEVIVDQGLRERRCGSVQGLTHDQILDRFGIDMKNILSDEIDVLPDVENFSDFRKRVDATMDAIESKWKGRKVLAVTHGGFVRSFYEEHKPPAYEKSIFKNCSITGYQRNSDGWDLVYLHIPDDR